MLPDRFIVILNMQTLTVQVNDQSALKALHSLEEKHLIKIVDDAEWNSAALPGEPLSLKTFKSWIKEAENADTVSLKEAKSKWTGKRKRLQKLIR
jgi:hypothetical protein